MGQRRNKNRNKKISWDKNITYQNLMACIKSSTKKEVIVSTLKKIMNKQRTFIPQGTKTNLVEGRKQKRSERKWLK